MMAPRRSTATAYLYLITCNKNKKKYIGVSNNPMARWNSHQDTAAKGDKRPLYADMRKYGVEKFNFSILASGPRWSIMAIERAMITHWKSRTPTGYNIAPGGESPPSRRKKR